MLPRHVAPTVGKGPGTWPVEEDGEAVTQGEAPGDAERISSVGRRPAGDCDGRSDGVSYDEEQRTRLMADIMRLIMEPTTPDCTRTAGMELVGWLARRRPGETPHAIGVEEARESERRLHAARAKR